MKLHVSANHIDRSLQRFATKAVFSASVDCPIGIAAFEAFNLLGDAEVATCDGLNVNIHNDVDGKSLIHSVRRRFKMDDVGVAFAEKYDAYRHRNPGATLPGPVTIELTEVS